jgi:hypothetical protein
MLGLTTVLLATGCHNNDNVVAVADFPPHRVDGVYSVTGNHEVTVYWRANQEPDIDHYKIYRNLAAQGRSLIRTSTGPVRRHRCGERVPAIALAVDDAGQAYDLSFENVFDTRARRIGVSNTNVDALAV